MNTKAGEFGTGSILLGISLLLSMLNILKHTINDLVTKYIDSNFNFIGIFDYLFYINVATLFVLLMLSILFYKKKKLFLLFTVLISSINVLGYATIIFSGDGSYESYIQIIVGLLLMAYLLLSKELRDVFVN